MIEILTRLLGLVFVLAFFAVPIWVGWLVKHPHSRPLRWIRSTAINPITILYAAWVDRRAGQRLRNACASLPPGLPSMPLHEWRYISEPLRRWCTVAPWAAVVHAFKLAMLAAALLNVGTLVNVAQFFWNNPPGSKGARLPPMYQRAIDLLGGSAADFADSNDDGGALAPLASLLMGVRRAVGWVAHKLEPLIAVITDPLAKPLATATTLLALVLLFLFLVALRTAAAVFINNSEEGRTQHEDRPWLARTETSSRGRVGETARWRPVVVLLAVCGSIGRAYKRWDTCGPLDAPRVSLAAAERAVWSAWKARHDRIRRTRRHEMKEHAALVVGALRAMEARQDSEADTGQVFEDAARMLLKIAQRYGEGRTLALLDPEDLAGITPVVNREWVRLVIVGCVVVGAAAGANLLGVPDSASGPLIGIVSLITVGVLYGARLVGTDLMDVMRGQSRK